MNKVFDAETCSLVSKRVDETSSFIEVNDALYYHEHPLIGSNIDLGAQPEWEAERDRLYALWVAKSPYKPAVDPCAIKGSGLMKKCISFFKERATT